MRRQTGGADSLRQPYSAKQGRAIISLLGREIYAGRPCRRSPGYYVTFDLRPALSAAPCLFSPLSALIESDSARTDRKTDTRFVLAADKLRISNTDRI